MAIDFENIQNVIGYRFKNTDLLQQAFVRKSYSEENGGQNNEVLEFIGDKALDLVVIRLMMEKFGVITEDKDFNEFKLRNPKYFKTKFDEGKFTDIKKDLVEKKALAHAMDDLGFHTYLIMGNSDINNNVCNQDSVKEDLFEAIIGAVALDCEWDLDVLTNVVETMIDFDSYFENDFETGTNYVGMIQEWFQKNQEDIPNYEYTEYYNSFTANLYIEGIGGFSGEGISKAKARMDCAEKAYKYLKQNGYIVSKYEEAIGEPDEDRALMQLNELVQKKLISKPVWKEKRIIDEDGEQVWSVTLIIEDCPYKYTFYEDKVKDARRECAYDFLVDLLNDFEED